MSRKRRIIIAKSAGFCWGVQRAFNKVLDIAKNHTESAPVYTYGPLIHNPQEIKRLAKEGIKSVDSGERLSGCKLVLRTHGVPSYSVDTGRLVFMNQCRHFPSQKIKHAHGHKSEIHNFCPTAKQAKFEIRRRIKWIGIVL